MQTSASVPSLAPPHDVLQHPKITARRKSAPALSRRPSCVSSHSDTNAKHVWRSPGLYEVPDILGKAYLKPDATQCTYNLRPEDKAKQISKKPWYPPNPYYEAPSLPASPKVDSKWATKLRKWLPKKVVLRSSDPRQRYTGFKEIGTGVNGAVVSAHEKLDPRRCVAIKRCRVESNVDYRAALLREVKIMATGHRNVIQLREVTLWRNTVWIAMDLMRCSVFSVLCHRGLSEAHTMFITRETLKALIYLHGKGLFHRDIKCENLLLGWDGQVKLADFGLSGRTSRRNLERLGTTKWMAPEVVREQHYNEKIDMWSLGITIIEMMDRVPPNYQIKDEEELFAMITSLPTPTFTYSYPCMYTRGLVAWLLDEDPSARPDAKDVLLEIDAHIHRRLLPCSSSAALAAFLNKVLPF